MVMRRGERVGQSGGNGLEHVGGRNRGLTDLQTYWVECLSVGGFECVNAFKWLFMLIDPLDLAIDLDIYMDNNQ